MPWHKQVLLSRAKTSSTISSESDAIYIRCSQKLYCLTLGDAPALRWSYPIPRDETIVDRALISFPTSVVTSFHPGEDRDQTMLIAINPADQTRRWERPIAWSYTETCGGLFAYDGKLVALEQPAQPRLLLIDPADGTLLHATAPLQVPGSDRSHWPLAGVVLGPWLYMLWVDLGLYRIDLRQPDAVPMLVLAGKLQHLAHVGEMIYVHEEGQQQVIQIDGRSGEEVGRCSFPAKWEINTMRSFLPDHVGQVLLTFLGGGVAALRIGADQPLWQLQVSPDDPSREAFTPADTPYGVIVNFADIKQSPLVVDRLTGALLPPMPAKHAKRAIWHNDHLFMSSIYGIEIWVWHEGETEHLETTVIREPAPTPAAPQAAPERTPEQQADDAAFTEVIKAFVNGMMLDAGEEQTQALRRFNTLCNAFFARHPEASLASIAHGLTQFGMPYEQAIGDVTWARTFGSEQ